jgi:hypothetical protein
VGKAKIAAGLGKCWAALEAGRETAVLTRTVRALAAEAGRRGHSELAALYTKDAEAIAALARAHLASVFATAKALDALDLDRAERSDAVSMREQARAVRNHILAKR